MGLPGATDLAFGAEVWIVVTVTPYDDPVDALAALGRDGNRHLAAAGRPLGAESNLDRRGAARRYGRLAG